MSDEAKLQSKADYDPTPADQAKRWDVELRAAKKNQDQFWTDGDKVVKEFLGDGPGRRLNLYHSDVVTKGAQLYGNIPKVRARRRFADANDDQARVSAEALERLLNTDIEREDDGFRDALANALGDWLKPGLGQVRLRYVVDWTTQPGQPAITQPDPVTGEEVEVAPAVPEQEVKSHEDVETDHVHWKDFLWSPCRTWAEARWSAVKAPMTKDEFSARFGEEAAKKISLTRAERRDDSDDAVKDVWDRVDVWEIWDKESKQVVWHIEGHPEVLETKPDPLELPGFFPWPRPLVANVTTTKFIPKANFYLAQHLYEEAHELTARIKALVEAVKVAGVCDKTNAGIQRLLTRACENEIIPVDSFAAFMEKGGMAGAMAFLPIEPTVNAVAALVQQRNIVIGQLHQITGQSDIMRGQAQEKATATEQRIKARFGSTRIQMDQQELARFASDAQRIRAHIIAKHFDPQTIITRANLTQGPDAALAGPAVELLKSEFASYRIEVDAESLAMTDYDAVKQERTEFLQAMTMFLGEAGKIAQMDPRALPFLLELGKHGLAGFRGAAALEGIFDKMLEAVKQPAPPRPDPKAQAEQVKAQAAMQGAQMDMAVKKVETQAHMLKAQTDVQKAQAMAALRPQMMPADPGAPL